MTWQEFESEVNKLAGGISAKPDFIAGIMRGGIVPARVLAARLGVNSMFCVSVEKKGSKREIITEVPYPVAEKNILLVEDALESGGSLIAVKQYLESLGAHVATAALYIQQDAEIKPDHYLGVKEQIPKFPWE